MPGVPELASLLWGLAVAEPKPLSTRCGTVQSPARTAPPTARRVVCRAEEDEKVNWDDAWSRCDEQHCGTWQCNSWVTLVAVICLRTRCGATHRLLVSFLACVARTWTELR